MGLRFKVSPADVEECNLAKSGPANMVLSNAALKAEALSVAYSDSLVLASDTTVALGDEIFNKPIDMADARAMLKRLSGRQHSVYTAVTLIWEAGRFRDDFVERSQVVFKPFGDDVIDDYFQVVNPLDKAGAYGIQQAREMIIESVLGSVENVMGLPIQALQGKLDEHRFDFRV